MESVTLLLIGSGGAFRSPLRSLWEESSVSHRIQGHGERSQMSGAR